MLGVADEPVFVIAPFFQLYFLYFLCDECLTFWHFADLQFFFKVVIDVLSLGIDFIPHDVSFGSRFLALQSIVVGVAVIATLEGVGVSESEFPIEDDPPAPLLADVFIPIFCFHVLPWKYALLEFKIYAILTKNFGKQMTLHLFDVVEDGVAKDEVAFVGRMSM